VQAFERRQDPLIDSVEGGKKASAYRRNQGRPIMWCRAPQLAGRPIRDSCKSEGEGEGEAGRAHPRLTHRLPCPLGGGVRELDTEMYCR
jgi:hypothetical protein